MFPGTLPPCAFAVNKSILLKREVNSFIGLGFRGIQNPQKGMEVRGDGEREEEGTGGSEGTGMRDGKLFRDLVS